MAETEREFTNSKWRILKIFLIFLAIIFLYTLYVFWPGLTPNDSCDCSEITFLFWHLNLTVDTILLILIGVAGALGSLLYALRSLTWHLGKKSADDRWIFWYYAKPLIGIILAEIFYVVIRGGFFSLDASINDANFYTFIGLGGLVGLFSESAIAKLQEIASAIFSIPEKAEKNKKEEDIKK